MKAWNNSSSWNNSETTPVRNCNLQSYYSIVNADKQCSMFTRLRRMLRLLFNLILFNAAEAPMTFWEIPNGYSLMLATMWQRLMLLVFPALVFYITVAWHIHSSTSDTMSSLDQLPLELSWMIFDYVPKSILAIRSVGLHQYSEQHYVWYFFTKFTKYSKH